MQAYEIQSPPFNRLSVLLRADGDSAVRQRGSPSARKLGLFQLLTKEALQRMFHVAPAEAARFSLVLWGTVTIPLLIAGARRAGWPAGQNCSN